MEINWSDFKHAYGNASDLGEILEQMSPDMKTPVWGELFSRICHQGSVYSASFEALPVLLEQASQWPPVDRCMILGLASAIVVGEPAGGTREQMISGKEWVLPRFHKLTLESLAVEGYRQNDFVYLLQAACAFEGDTLWGSRLEGFVDEEFHGLCPKCESELHFVFTDDIFITAEEWVNSVTKRTPIVPQELAKLPALGQWLHKTCKAGGQSRLAELFLYLFGNGQCPDCDTTISIVEAVKKMAIEQ